MQAKVLQDIPIEFGRGGSRDYGQSPPLQKKEPVAVVAFLPLPDGRVVIAERGGVAGGSRVWIWDSAASIPDSTVQVPSVRSLAWLEEGGLLATGSDDGKVRLWDLWHSRWACAHDARREWAFEGRQCARVGWPP